MIGITRNRNNNLRCTLLQLLLLMAMLLMVHPKAVADTPLTAQFELVNEDPMYRYVCSYPGKTPFN